MPSKGRPIQQKLRHKEKPVDPPPSATAPAAPPPFANAPAAPSLPSPASTPSATPPSAIEPVPASTASATPQLEASPPPSVASAGPTPPLPPPLPSNVESATGVSPSTQLEPLLIEATSATSAAKNPKKLHLVSGEAPVKIRIVVSNKTQHLMKTTGKKIKVEYFDFHSEPKTRELYNMLVCDIGTAIKSHMPMLAPTFSQLEPHQRNTLTSYMEMYYDISLNDKELLAFIKKKAQLGYADWKYDCHQHFLQHGNNIPNEFKLRPEQWVNIYCKQSLAREMC